MKTLSIALACAALFVTAVATADDAIPSRSSPSIDSQAPAPLFRAPVVLRGTLGDMKVQLTVRPKAVADEGLEGEYFIFGHSARILLAGEMEGDALFLEESENGIDISGQWDGKLQGDSLSGTWTSADGNTTKPFTLQALSSAAKPAPIKKLSAHLKQ